MTRHRTRTDAAAVAVVALVCVVSGCTGGPGGSSGTDTTVTMMPPTSVSSVAASGSVPPTTEPSITPRTVEGMLTGPGVDNASISLGLIVDPEADRGFSAGVTLWQDTVNETGGICDRTVQIAPPADGATADEAYTELGRSTLGLITLEPGATGLSLASRIRNDRIPALSPEGTAEKIGGQGTPVVLGATDDILAINTAAYLLAGGILPEGGTLGVLVDDSAGAADALAGLTWWADANQISLLALEPGDTVPDEVTAVYAATDAEQVADLLAASADAGAATSATTVDTTVVTEESAGSGDAAPEGSEPPSAPPPGTAVTGSDTSAAEPESTDVPAGLTVATTLRGYDPALLPDGAGDRLLVATVTPAPGADHPAVQAIDTAFADADLGEIGPRTLAGYATGQTWGRLLEAMCATTSLTRSTAIEQLAALPPASPDSLLGATDPAQQVSTGGPASVVSALSAADPSAPGGLRPLTLLESAPNIADYRSG